MANEGNLRPFKKGSDPRRNLKGRPIGATTFNTLLHKAMMKEVKTSEGIMPGYAVVMNRLMDKAIKGDVRSIRLILDIVDGPLKKSGKMRKERPSDDPYFQELEKKRMMDHIKMVFGPEEPKKPAQ